MNKYFTQFTNLITQKDISAIEEKYQNVPVTHFTNDGSSRFELKRDMGAGMIAVH